MDAKAADDFDCDMDLFDERNDADDHYSLFKAASQGPDALKDYLEGLPRHARNNDSRARTLAFDFPAPSSSISTSELMFADLASNRGWTDLEADAVLKVLKDRSFNISEISSNSMRALFHKINSDSAAEPEFEVINLWKEGDRPQKVELFIRDLKGVFLEIITSVDPSELDLYFHAVIDKHGKRWFTVHANSGLWWEKAQKKVGPNVAVGAALFFIDGVHLKQHIGLQAAYCKSKHLLFI